MDRTAIADERAKAQRAIEDAAHKLTEEIRVDFQCSTGWALEALAEEHVDQLKVLATEYKVELTEDVRRGIWLAAQLVLDMQPEDMLADD
jgi:hypothetical protein